MDRTINRLLIMIVGTFALGWIFWGVETGFIVTLVVWGVTCIYWIIRMLWETVASWMEEV